MVMDRLTGFATSLFGPANQIANEVKELQDMYQQRQKGFNRWYKLLSMEDELAQDKMESFVGNDPRTTWNMSVYLLQPKPLVIKIESTNGTIIPAEARTTVEIMQQYFNSLWQKINSDNQQRGQETWFWNFIGFLVSTGWYAVPYIMEPDGKVTVDYWNPAHVYPEFSDNPEDGLLRLARIRTVSGAKAEARILANGWAWPVSRKLPSKPVEGHLWKRTQAGIVHGVIIDNQVVKPLTVMPGLTKIPILAGAVAGIPRFDDSSTDKSDTLGQSVLATNESLYRTFNKMQSFNMQLLRDTANPRVFERSVGNTPIVKNAEEWYTRGAMFRGGPQDDLSVIQMPGIPVELTQLLFTVRNGIQRGSFSDLTLGNVVGEISAGLVTQAAEAALQLITPFHNAVKYITSESTDSWYHMYLENPELRPSNWPEIPPEVLEILRETKINATYAIKIPGDLASRIAMSKQLNTSFQLPVPMVMDLMLPEVTNVPAAIAQLEAERAKLHPSYAIVQLIQAFEEAANQARAADNPDQAALYSGLAQQLTKQITGQPTVDDKLGNNGTGQEAQDVIPPQSVVDSRLGRSPNGTATT